LQVKTSTKQIVSRVILIGRDMLTIRR